MDRDARILADLANTLDLLAATLPDCCSARLRERAAEICLGAAYLNRRVSQRLARQDEPPSH